MGSYPATVHLVPGDGTERPQPFDLRVATRIGAVELRLGQLSGGETLRHPTSVTLTAIDARQATEHVA